MRNVVSKSVTHTHLNKGKITCYHHPLLFGVVHLPSVSLYQKKIIMRHRICSSLPY